MSLLLQLNLLVILVLFLILLSRCMIISPQLLNLASYLFAIFEGLETLYLSTARTIATSLIHSKLDYCNSLFLNLPQSQLGHLQLILNSSARAVSKTPKFAHIYPVLKSFHWLIIEQRIQYKVASIVLQSEQPSYLHCFLSVQSNRTTRSSDVITLQCPSFRSGLKLTDRSFTLHCPVLWNFLHKQLRQPSAPPSLGTAPDSSLLALSSHQFHSKLKSFLFEQTFLC